MWRGRLQVLDGAPVDWDQSQGLPPLGDKHHACVRYVKPGAAASAALVLPGWELVCVGDVGTRNDPISLENARCVLVDLAQRS